jgi:glyoxylase-like metal-dependent hydrolase (beta-lactamase superfamily II)
MTSRRAIATAVVTAASVALLYGVPSAQVAAPTPTTRPANNSQPLDVLQVRPNIYLIAGAGGHIVAQVGTDGVLLVDTGRIAFADRVLATIKSITPKPIAIIINTSPDPDHVEANAHIAKAGRSVFNVVDSDGDEPVPVFATEKILLRMSAPSGQVSPFPTAAWPTDTFYEERRDLYFNDEGVQIHTLPGGPTDGNAAVSFRRNDVIVAGTVVDSTRFPVIDVAKGGSIQDEIDSLNKIIDMSLRPLPFPWQEEKGTRIIPSRGRVYDKISLVDYRDMVVVARDRVADGIKRGRTVAQLQAEEPLKDFEVQYGSKTGTWTTNKFIEAVYQSLTKKEER